MSSRNSANPATAPKGPQTATQPLTPVVSAKAGTSKSEASLTAQRLLELYERVADAPGAVERLRKFVLDLAVRGKLVEQDPGDEPASVVLERIDAARALVPKNGRAISKRVDDPTLTEIPYSLPNGWGPARLAELARVVNGRAYKKAELLEEGTPVLRVGNLFTSKHWYYSDLELEEDKYCEKGDLIYAWSASFGPFIWEGPRAIFHYHIWKLPLFSEVDLNKKFLYLFLLQKTKEIKEAGHGVSMVHMTKAKMEQLAVPVPPLAEQARIVARVNDLMALLDRLETTRSQRETTRNRLTTSSLTRLTAPETTEADFPTHARFALDNLDQLTSRPEQIKMLRQTILNLAVRGKLVEQNPGDEPASELLKRIAADKNKRAVSARDRRAGKIKPLDLTSTPFDLPPSWVWAAFGDITISRDGERVPVSKADRENRDKIYDYYGASGVIDKIDGYLFDKPLLLIGEDGANLLNRSTPIAFIARGKYWVNNHAHVLDGLSEGYLRYLELFINATDLKPFVTGTAQPKMNQAKMNSIPVALPPLAEQHRIIAKVDILTANCDRLETAISNNDTTRARLFQNLIHVALPSAHQS